MSSLQDLFRAISQGNINTLRDSCLTASFIDGVDVNNNIPLFWACCNGHGEIVNLLLRVDGILVNKGTENHTPLSIASEKGYLKIVELLLKVLSIDINKCNPLLCACKNKHFEIIKTLISDNPHINIEEEAILIFDKNIKPHIEPSLGLKEVKEYLNEDWEFFKYFDDSSDEQRNRNLYKQIESLENRLQVANHTSSVKQVVRIPKSSQTIHSLKMELNRVENQIKDLSTCGVNVEFKELNELVEERNRIREEIIANYSGKLNEFENDKKELLAQIERMGENETNLESFQSMNKLKLKKKDLLKELALIKDEIDEIDLEKDELVVQIKTQKRNKLGNIETIERLEKKLTEMLKKLSDLNEQKTEIEQNLMELITTFPEVIVELKQPLTADGVVGNSSQTPKDKFRVFALEHLILLLNTQYSDYRIIEILHTGLSVVYKASKSNNQVVILKEISLTENNCETVMNEILNIVILKGHSRIIKLNGVFIEPNFNKVYIETPYYSNGNLLEYINKIKTQHDTKTLKIMLRSLFRKITETLQFIHSKDILHRDLKPQNILVNENGEPIIADFGSSKRLIAQLTNNTMGVGTLKYMAPEVKRQVEAPSEKSDIWSLGVSLYECWQLIQQKSTINNTTVEILNFDSQGKVVLPIENQQDEIDILLMKMLGHMFNSNPIERPSSLTLLTDSDYFTHENPITTDILSKSNQKELDSSEKLDLWQARLKKLKELTLPEKRNGEIKFEINRHNLLQDISTIIYRKVLVGGKTTYLIYYKTFVKYKGETGIDQGGLSNELYSKYIEAMLMESKHFQKSDTNSNENFILTDEPLTDESRIKLSAFGWLLKKLLIDCDDKTVYLPLNSFIFYYLLNGDNLFKKESPQLNSISLILSKFLREYDFDLDNQIMNLNNCKNDEELQSITMEETFIDVLSKSEKPLIMQNVQLFIISQLFSYFYSNLKIEINKRRI